MEFEGIDREGGAEHTERGGGAEHTEQRAEHSERAEARRPEVGKTPRRKRFTELVAMLAVGLAASAVGVSLWAQAPAKASTSPDVATRPVTCTGSAAKLTVQGTGVASAAPDLLSLSAAINVTKATAQSALEADNNLAAAVEAKLETDGVAKKDVQTTGLSIQPSYTWANNSETLTGYSVSDTISADFHAPFATAGEAIDDIDAIGGNDVQIQGLEFSFADPQTVEDQARDDAVTQAVSHAQSMAKAAGEELGPVCSVTDDSVVQPTSPYSSPAFGTAQDQASAAKTATPLQPGTQQEGDQVTVVYALKPARS